MSEAAFEWPKTHEEFREHLKKVQPEAQKMLRKRLQPFVGKEITPAVLEEIVAALTPPT